jgi:membrane-bound lytic murein transglycosylase D
MREEPTKLRGCGRYQLVLVAIALMVLSGCVALRPAPVQQRNASARREVLWALVPPATESGKLAPGRKGASPAKATGAAKAGGYNKPAPDSDVLAIDHPLIDRFVDELQNERREFVQRALDRSGEYREVMAPILQEEGVPTELTYVPLIESGFNNAAVSRSQAVGPWQFVRDTGKRYGLRIDSYVDERRDPEKSTRAAARYLRDLYDMFGAWPLALAAYNTGERRVGGIIEQRGEMSFWEMTGRGYLYRETCDYVPAVLAAARIGAAPADYGFEAPVMEPLSYEVVEVDRSISLRQVAQMAQSSFGELQALNPALIRGLTPPGSAAYELRVPQGTGHTFEVAYARWRRGLDVESAAVPETAPIADWVRKGDTLTTIARRHGVSVSLLMQVNGWKKARRLSPGEPVRLPFPKARLKGTRAAAASGHVHLAAKLSGRAGRLD